MSNDELIKCSKEFIEYTLQSQLQKKKYYYLIPEFADKLDSNTEIRFYGRSFNWDESKKQISELDEYYSVNWYIPLYAEGNILLTDVRTGIRQEIDHSFSLFISLWFHFDKENPEFTFDIHDRTKNLLFEYNRKIESIIEEHGLYNLLNDNTRYDEKNGIQFFSEIIRHQKNRPVPFPESDFDVYDDIARCHQDITFALGELIAYKPYISNFTEHSVNVGENVVFQYFPSFNDKRYLSTCSMILELLYNYWDKIGDILAPYFTPSLKEKQVYFGKVIEKIEHDYIENEHYQWLLNFKKGVFSDLNLERKQVVHYTSVETQIYKRYQNNNYDINALTELQNAKENYCDYFLKHFELTSKGFYHSLKLIQFRYENIK